RWVCISLRMPSATDDSRLGLALRVCGSPPVEGNEDTRIRVDTVAAAERRLKDGEVVRHQIVCRKCAVRFEPERAKASLFNTPTRCIRAGLAVGK
ncbi:MAG: hypothetical protein JWO20_1332, partial [Candidatus Angelobacter sp.]|nr:hypothetical protein [Candidatus Angelobacter sp.]